MFNRESLLSYDCEKDGSKTIRARIKQLVKDSKGEYALLTDGQKIDLRFIKSINGKAI